MKWVCKICGYEHEGDAPPDECPLCAAGPEEFEPVDDAPAAAAPAPRADAPAEAVRAVLRCALCERELGDATCVCPNCASRAASLSLPPSFTPHTSAKGRRYAVVGGGVAGFTAAERIRAADPDGSIVLVTSERCAPYYRLSLTRYIGGEIDAAELFVHPQGWWSDRRIELAVGTEVLDVRRSEHELITSAGKLPYDRLVAATGARSFVPPLGNLAVRNALPLRTIHDAREILSLARPGTRAVVVGGGVLGLETAFGLARRGCEITVCEGSTHLLSRQLDPASAAIFQRHLEQKGIGFALGTLPASLVGDEAVRGVKLADESVIDAELVVLSAGVRPNNLVWQRAGLTVSKGLVVDDAMRTSDPDIFAAGDGAEHKGVLYGIWPASLEMGKVAGDNAAGGASVFSGFPMSYGLKVVDLDLFSIGLTRANEPGTSELVLRVSPPAYAKLVLRDGVIAGAILLGDTSMSGRIREAVLARRSVGAMIEAGKSADEIFAAIA